MPSEISVSAGTPMPKAYGFLPKGNRYKTLHCRKLTHEAARPLYIVFEKKKQIGLRAPLAILDTVHKQAKQTLSTRRAATNRRDATDTARASAEMEKQFPHMPQDEQETVLRHGFKKYSGRVGRTNSIPLSRKVLLAVIAHVRHRHTEYDTLLDQGIDREDARKSTRKGIERLLQKWGYSQGTLLKVHRR
ncbi:hypothetical protein COCC4DRAFT_58047 [Bipolaris maydis ATCC 48331]|uniref:DUF2293 domain-containing protein n=2 Tax=Cochliobolus heterostrophus TaxID=5016 RepID=M2UFK6_COCH5|nr:uncharacterized protein COCC4DRAFT_58047 [Bipolaris maydis ATCC 48331]EMD92491.1 hypothetical protein COCHEDRAFT_1155462 [Bipolaris maydis C5]KAH7552917.1 hypothetical protein BM1_07890 [Bipolaris maydis]ENI08185.1 hypothetical protein COCC4DRAFT_58047 [Bipolaris maydis ATCC 48331]KAJ5022310.1 hypothetical protein J3E73DRAFT_374581 [Bipolaris maydis]KAJ5061006.1 hypothetical protein J3E74DRAFT_213681 [Bipolaris maydis]